MVFEAWRTHRKVENSFRSVVDTSDGKQMHFRGERNTSDVKKWVLKLGNTSESRKLFTKCFERISVQRKLILNMANALDREEFIAKRVSGFVCYYLS